MRLLLDTCAFIWLTSEPDQLGAEVSHLIDTPATELLVSDCSVWEICLKWEAAKLVLPRPPRMWVEEQMKAWRITPLRIERIHLYRVSELPPYHRDPFDRLLIAQAIEDGLTLATPDEQIVRYPVSTAW